MMLLSDISTKGYDSFENAGYRVPKYNRKNGDLKTKESLLIIFLVPAIFFVLFRQMLSNSF